MISFSAAAVMLLKRSSASSRTSFSRRLFGALALGNIFLDTKIMGDCVVLIPDGGNRSQFPIQFAVLLAVVKFASPFLPGRDGIPHLAIVFH